MKSAVFNKDLIGPRSGYNYARQEDSLHIALQRLRIANRQFIRSLETHAHALKETEVGMIPRHRKHKVVLDRLDTLRRLQNHSIRRNLQHVRVEVRFNLAVLDAVLDIGLA